MNLLSLETSPYLLQHAQNPVHWKAWRPEILAEARAENRMILLSIGYSTCHWCHVMERESFENEAVAELMNAHFLCIKVDREERPDVDQIYMDACQILTGSGGWPLNVFCLPDGRPFYAGTYFPPRAAFNRPSWTDLLLNIAQIWREKPTVVVEQAERLMAAMHRVAMPPKAENIAFLSDFLKKTPTKQQKIVELGRIFYTLSEDFDRKNGGFGGAPKFPSTMALRWLMAYFQFSKNEDARDFALFSLEKMVRGGIFDQLGGGFSRYSVDSGWLVPHFEKMIYDNALLLSALSDAFKISKNPIFSEAIESTFEWILREMTHSEGGFFSAQDADSEGVEGKFFVWDKNEIVEILGEDAVLFCEFFDVSESGNWEETNILNIPIDFERFCKNGRFDPIIIKNKLKNARKRLFEHREKRIRPNLDDKILLGWSALLVSGLAHAHEATGNEKMSDTAQKALDFLMEKMPNFHTRKNGVGQIDPFLEDFAFLIKAMLDLWEISPKKVNLEHAVSLTDRVISEFWDENHGFFYFVSEKNDDLVIRRIDFTDNATPSGNAVMAENLQRLAILANRPDFRAKSQKMLENMAERIHKHPLAYSEWARVWMFETVGRAEIVVVGKDSARISREIREQFLPARILAFDETGENRSAVFENREFGNGLTEIYFCENQICHAPVKTVEELTIILRNEGF